MSKYPYIAEILKQESTVDIKQQAEDLTNDMKTILAEMLTSIKENNARQEAALVANEDREKQRDADEKERRLSPDGTTAAEDSEKLRENQQKTKKDISEYKRNLKNLDADRKNKTTDDKLRGSKLQQFLGTQGSPKPRKKKEKTVSVWEKSLQSQRKRRQKIKENKLYVDNQKNMGAKDNIKTTWQQRKDEEKRKKQAGKDMEGFQADEENRKKLETQAQVESNRKKREELAEKTDAKIRESKYKNASEDSEDIFWFNQVIKIV